VNSKKGENTCYFYRIIQSSWKQVPQQELGLHFVELPSFLTALNNTTDESYQGTDSSIVLTRTQGPPNKRKTPVANRVAIITKKHLQQYGDVPSQSNPVDLISRGMEPSTLPTYTMEKGTTQVIKELSSWPTTEVPTTTDNLEIRNVYVAHLQPL
jgi:hypothetical protein